MEEKTIIQSKQDTKKMNILIGIVAASFILFIVLFAVTWNLYTSEENTASWLAYSSINGYKYSYMTSQIIHEFYEFATFYISIVFGVLFIIFGILLIAMLQNRLVVSNVKVSGKMKFRVTVDLPVDKISAVKISGLFSAISISTSSGKNTFYLLSNYKEIYTAINELLQQRQQMQFSQKNETVASVSQADELKKYKELLDTGIISQEEFDSKKKQILGI